jgi:hypothetical protein
MSSRTDEPTSQIRPERPLTAQRLAQYVARGRCERHLRFTLFPSEAQGPLGRYGLEFEPLSPLLSGEGQRFERAMVERLAESSEVRDLSDAPPEAFAEELRRAAGRPRTLFYQPSLRGRIGQWPCEGRADLIEVTRTESGLLATVVDFKASARETVGFRLQVAFYARLLTETLRGAGFPDFEIKGAVAARDSAPAGAGVDGDASVEGGTREERAASGANEGSGAAPNEIANAGPEAADEGGPGARWRTFDLALFDDEIERLIAAPDSDVWRAVRAGAGRAAYHLRSACDGCPYNALCFADTAEREDLSLVPYITASEKRALESSGVRTARELAGLLAYGSSGALEPAPGREELLRRAASRWPLATRLPVLVQRARAALRRLDRRTEARPYVVGSDFGSLPDTGQYPELVRVFVDAQRDYLRDRLYLLAARVVGPRGVSEVIETTVAPPRTEDERELLVRFVRRLLPAVAEAASSQSAPLHFYTYAARGERALLDALARHFDALCSVPAFYDLLTSHPALTQPMVSLLSEEVRARHNLAPVCQNLYEVADALGFKWHDGETDFRRLFRARVFDNRRTFRRDPATGSLTRDPAAGLDPDDAEAQAPFVRVESAARFGTEIPLEYAYAAWGLLREETAADARGRAQVRGFAGVTAEQIADLARLRVRAMQHVEESFARRNRAVVKEPLDLTRLHEVEREPEEVPLSRSLEDFLLLEHHASFQEKMLHLARPARERIETGRTALLRCDLFERDEAKIERARFTLVGTDGRPRRAETGAPLRLRAGDWVVLNALTDAEGREPASYRLVRGRLGTVEDLDEAGLTLRLLPLTFKNSPFRYPHAVRLAPEAGALYTVDEMCDDLNADKFREACRHASSNHLYRWLSDPAEGKRPRAVRPRRLRDAEEVARLAARAQSPHGLTAAQSEIVGSRLGERVLVLQGPPGTGKSHTLGFAVLARAAAQATPARPFRVAVLARTHAAVSVALASVARRRAQLAAAAPAEAPDAPRQAASDQTARLVAPLARMKILKVCNDAGEAVPEGVGRVLSDGGDEQSAAGQWDTLMTEPLVVIGGTPGGLYRLVRDGASRGRGVDWSGEHFDLVVVDEASQMGLAEALTAAAFLREDGQFIAVGDHRQMPPILAHAWDQEGRRDLRRSRVFLSVFEYLLELGFPRVALDRSFRIPAEVADFLRRHVYAADGIEFRSENRTRLPACDGLGDGWLAAALAPEHALVVVEHGEEGSQQSNEFEAALVAEIVRAAVSRLNLDARRGVGVVVPHRAQKSLLASLLPEVAESVDTVERFQGGERELIVVSATVSDREFAAAESGFLLEPRRLTVAVSRPLRKLVLVASRAVFDLTPNDLDEYERGALWKRLRHEAAPRLLWSGEVAGHAVAVRAVGGGEA